MTCRQTAHFPKPAAGCGFSSTFVVLQTSAVLLVATLGFRFLSALAPNRCHQSTQLYSTLKTRANAFVMGSSMRQAMKGPAHR